MRALVASLVLTMASTSSPAREGSGRGAMLSIDGGIAVILASLIDRARLAGNGAHARELRCVIDGDRKACRGVKTTGFTVSAARIACSQSDVAVGTFACDLETQAGQGASPRAHLTGHAAFELQSALREAGVKPDGAAGHLDTVATAVSCTLDPKVLLEKAGGGARCELSVGGD